MVYIDEFLAADSTRSCVSKKFATSRRRPRDGIVLCSPCAICGCMRKKTSQPNMRNVIFLRLMCVSTESTWNYSMDLQGSPANYSAGLFSEGAVRLPAQRTPHRGGRLSKENAEWHGRAGHGESATARRQRRQGRVRIRGDAQARPTY